MTAHDWPWQYPMDNGWWQPGSTLEEQQRVLDSLPGGPRDEARYWFWGYWPHDDGWWDIQEDSRMGDAVGVRFEGTGRLIVVARRDHAAEMVERHNAGWKRRGSPGCPADRKRWSERRRWSRDGHELHGAE